MVPTKCRGWRLSCGDNGIVVRHFGVVKIPLGVRQPIGLETTNMFRVVGLAGELVKRFRHGLVHIFWKML